MGQETSPNVRELHDLLLAHKPSEASHDAKLCPLCKGSDDGADPANDSIPGGGDMSTHTEEELQSAVANAIKDVSDELTTLKASQEQAAIEDRINELVTSHETEKAELQSQVDTATAATEAATRQHDDLVAYLTEEGERQEAEEALATRKEEVAASVADTFSDEYVAENLDRWAALEAEAFEAMLSDWKAASATKPATEGDTKEPLVSNALTASADSSEGEPTVSDIRRSLHRNRHAFRNTRATN